MTENKRPNNPKLENAILAHGKCVCIEMLGNDCWKHQRDYKALVTLFERWYNSLDKNNELDKEYKKEGKPLLLITWEKFEDDWSKIEKVRMLTHQYMNELGDYPSEEYEVPEVWVIKRITELTNS